MRKINLKFSCWIAMAAIAFLFIVMPCSAEEIKYPTYSYEGEELAKIRKWEEEIGLVGKRIDHTNVDQLKEFLLEAVYEWYKDTDKWGENYFILVPYSPFTPFKEWIECTKEGWGKSSVDEGDFLQGHISGTPFPNPKTAIEVMYNYDCYPVWDNRRQYLPDNYQVDFRSGGVRALAADVEWPKIAERTVVPPIPEFPNNKKGIRSALLLYAWDPPEIHGLYQLDLNYKDRSREWDSWLWVPAIRRVRRLDTIQRQDHRGGGDYSLDDQNGWHGRIARNHYKLMGTKDLLVGRDNKVEELIYGGEGKNFYWQNIKRERVKTYIIEVINKDPQYMYKKQIFYIDPEYWIIAWAERFDRKGRLWKIAENTYQRNKTPTDQIDGEYCSQSHFDIQRRHSTYAKGAWDFEREYTLSHFTPAELNRIGR